MKTRWTVLSIPGGDSEPTTWFLYDRVTGRCVACRDRKHALQLAKS